MRRRSTDPVKSGTRRAKTQRRAGQGAKCAHCGETRAEMLVRSARPKLCLHCHAFRTGNSATELHHLAGRANSPLTVNVPIKDHRTLSEAQYEWPPGTLQNADGSPLITLAAQLRGTADFVGELVVTLVNSLAETAEKIDAWLRERHGRWWEDGPFDEGRPGDA